MFRGGLRFFGLGRLVVSGKCIVCSGFGVKGGVGYRGSLRLKTSNTRPCFSPSKTLASNSGTGGGGGGAVQSLDPQTYEPNLLRPLKRCYIADS